MCELEFRGKTLEGKWRYGLVAQKDGNWYISNGANLPFAYEVRPETIGQYIGLKDKNGKKIYGGDIVKASSTLEGSAIAIVEWGKERAGYYFAIGSLKFSPPEVIERSIGRDVEVVGNIHENPELLEGGK